MTTCADAVRQLWAYLENDLDQADRERIDQHLQFCRRCCGEAEFATALQGLLRSSARPLLPPDVEGRLSGFLDSLEVDRP